MYSKDFKAKNRDAIEHYLEQQGPVCNTQRHEQDAMCDTSLSFLQKNASSNLGALRAFFFFLNVPMYGIRADFGTNSIRKDSFVRTDQSQTFLAGEYCEIRPMKDDFCKGFIRTGRGDWRAWYISHSTMK